MQSDHLTFESLPPSIHWGRGRAKTRLWPSASERNLLYSKWCLWEYTVYCVWLDSWKSSGTTVNWLECFIDLRLLKYVATGIYFKSLMLHWKLKTFIWQRTGELALSFRERSMSSMLETKQPKRWCYVWQRSKSGLLERLQSFQETTVFWKVYWKSFK